MLHRLIETIVIVYRVGQENIVQSNNCLRKHIGYQPKQIANDNKLSAIENWRGPSHPPRPRQVAGESNSAKHPRLDLSPVTINSCSIQYEATMKQACMHLSDAVWTLTYSHNTDGTVTIQNFEREGNDGYMFSDTLPTLDSIKEGDGRVVEEVTIDGTSYVVRNKQNVFTYKQPL